jgi:MFS family permease
MVAAGWFALLSPIVPPALRGRFFGRLRMSWQIMGVLFLTICGVVLARDASVSTYQILLGIATLGSVIRIIFYVRIPELDPPAPNPVPVKEALSSVIAAPGYISFCAYVFLLGLCTGGSLNIFGMVEKNVLELNDNLIVWLGNATMIGAIIGFFIGGRAVDRYSTKPVFLVCHFGFGAVLLTFLARHLAGTALVPALAGVHLFLGMLLAASSIAISTELLALIPPMNKSLSTTMAGVLLQLSASISGLLAAWVLDLNILADQWKLGGATLSAYDSILALWAILVLLFVVTLGLVPSVIRKAEWMPGGA